MSALARYLRSAGAVVSGSDIHRSSMYEALQRDGFRVYDGQEETNVTNRIELAIHTAAAASGNPEVTACREKGIPLKKYAEMLGHIMKEHEGIAVSGTHGKTTVSAMTAFLLRAGGCDPSFVIGGTVPSLGGVGGGKGKGRLLVVEACEFDRSFLNLAPRRVVVTNIEEDHLDCYSGLEDLRGAFAAFLGKLNKSGPDRGSGDVIAWDSIEDLNAIAGRDMESIFTFGFEEDASLRIIRPKPDRSGTAFDIVYRGNESGPFRINMPGRHNVLNAGAAILTANRSGCDLKAIKKALPEFNGVSRRLELRVKSNTLAFYSDYAHHPTEIRAVCEALRTAHPKHRVVAVYQAHQRSRTAYFLDGLGEALACFDLALLVETFSVRENAVDHLPGGRELSRSVVRSGGRSFFIGEHSEIPDKVPVYLEDGDVLVFMGAGNIDEVAGVFEKKLHLH